LSASAASIESLLAEQRAYYRAISGEYEQNAIPGWNGGGLQDALEAFAPRGEVLELACGPGSRTVHLARHAEQLTALDAAPEMLALARRRVLEQPAVADLASEQRVRFVQADVFSWQPDRLYDVVAFAFWLSHVPPQRFDEFWALLQRCLKPHGRVFFVDDAHRTAEELAGEQSGFTVRRGAPGGTRYRIVKSAWTPAQLQARLAALGWAITVASVEGPFFCGQGTRATRSRQRA
jgi:SAM-dependent methyltransferase